MRLDELRLGFQFESRATGSLGTTGTKLGAGSCGELSLYLVLAGKIRRPSVCQMLLHFGCSEECKKSVGTYCLFFMDTCGRLTVRPREASKSGDSSKTKSEDVAWFT